MKRNRLAFTALLTFTTLFSPLALHAQNFSWSVTPEFSWHFGEQTELVYTNNPDDQEIKLSELNWDEKNIPMAGVTFGFLWDNLELNVGTKAGIPSAIGSVYDYDWFNSIQNASYLHTVSLENTRNPDIASVITNYSRHNNSLNAMIEAETKLSYSFTGDDGSAIMPFLSADFTYTSFTARGGEKSYGKFNEAGNYYYSYDDEDASHLSQKAYDQNQVILELDRRYYNLWLGTQFDLNISDRFHVVLGGALLGFSYVNSIDTHTISHSYYKDKCWGVLCGVQGNLEAQYFIKPNQSFFLKGDFKVSSTIKGKTFGSGNKYGNYTEYSDSWAGSGFWNAEFSAGYCILF